MSDKQQLVKALKEAGATELQCVIAGLLFQINGLDNALEFVKKVQENGMTTKTCQLTLIEVDNDAKTR